MLSKRVEREGRADECEGDEKVKLMSKKVAY